MVTVLHSRENKGKEAVIMIETDTPIDASVKRELESMSAVHSVVTMERII